MDDPRFATCARCDRENPAAARFCMHCAAELPARCGGCGAPLPGAAHFCPQCAQPIGVTRDLRAYTPKHLAETILRSRSALEGERKLVTVLFADVKGSLELSVQTGAEAWHEVLDRFFRILADGVHRFEGTINQYTGDGIMALFGAPIAHEDHAQRACYAALLLRDELRAYADELRLSRGLDFAFRMGINTGEVVVGKIGDDLRMDYTAQGVAAGLAQRMEQIAAANSICLSDRTAHLAAGYFDLRNLGLTAVKGISEPIPVFELIGLGEHRTRLDRARGRGLTRFVGRDTDLAALETALEQARAGKGQVVGVVAEAGTGKSRLCLEFVLRCRARGIRVDEGHCPAHGRTVPYLPVLALLRAIFEIGDRDREQEARRKIGGELLLLDERFRELLPLVYDFLGVADPEHPAPQLSPEARQRQIVAFMRHLIQARSEREPQVFLIDDAHWIDAGSDTFLAHAVEAVSDTRTLWLVNFRPEYHADWMSKSFYRKLPLLPLGREATAELVAELLGRDPSLATLSERIHEHTRGNPFFIEELSQSLVESGSFAGSRGAYRLIAPVERLELPGTVQAVLAARIDRLPEREKRLLQTASVIGKDFPEPILKRVAEVPDADLPGALAALVRAELLVEKALYPAAEYAFKHPLTHDVAYESQLSQPRARTHAAVARALEEVYAARLDERAALLAQHWDAAGDAAEGVRWHARAARWCELGNMAEAHRQWSQVWALREGAGDSDEIAALRLEAATQLLLSGTFMGMNEVTARAILEEGLALASERKDLRSRTLLLSNFGMIFASSGELSTGKTESEAAFELAARSGDPGVHFSVHEDVIDRLQWAGGLAKAAVLADSYVECGRVLDRAATTKLPVAWSIGRRAWVWIDMGRLDDAEDALRECAERLQGSAAREVECWTEVLRAKCRRLAGDLDAARVHAQRGFELAELLGSALSRVWARAQLGAALGSVGECALAVEHLERALGSARAARVWLTTEAEILSDLAEAQLGRGDAERAQRTAEEAIETGRRRGTAIFEIRAQLALARVLLAHSGAAAREEIERALANGLSLVERTEARVYEPCVHELRAELAGLLGDEAEAARERREAQRLFMAIGAPAHAERLGSGFSR